jgi:hypothetical protein
MDVRQGFRRRGDMVLDKIVKPACLYANMQALVLSLVLPGGKYF